MTSSVITDIIDKTKSCEGIRCDGDHPRLAGKRCNQLLLPAETQICPRCGKTKTLTDLLCEATAKGHITEEMISALQREIKRIKGTKDMERQLWQELYEKTAVAGEISWRRVAYETFEAEVDGRKLTLSKIHYGSLTVWWGNWWWIVLDVQEREKSGSTMSRSGLGTFWHKTTAKKLFNFLQKRFAEQDTKECNNQLQQALARLQQRR